MQQPRFIEIRPLRGWKAGLLVVVAGAVAATLLMVFGLVLLFAVPVLLVAGLVTRWLFRREIREARSRFAGPRTIETQYEVLEAEHPDRQRPRG